MLNPPTPAWAASRRVVHVAGRVTGDVARFLGPATSALARAGIEQTVVMIDELACRPHIERLHPDVDLVPASQHRNPLRQWRALRKACRGVLLAQPACAVHFHGVLPALAAAWMTRLAQPGVPLFFSPHGSRALHSVLGALAMPLVRPLVRPWDGAAIVDRVDEARALESWPSTHLVEPPADRAFFDLPRQEARHPLIVTGGERQSPRNVELVAQMAVLLGGDEALRVGFNWLGGVDRVSRARLAASGVAVFDAPAPADRIARFGGAWIGLMAGPTRGYPHFLVDAMAAALPCVAFDCEPHRDLIRHGETGFLCPTVPDMIDRIAELIDDEILRARIGAAARAEVRRRFAEPQFARNLLSAYDARTREQPGLVVAEP